MKVTDTNIDEILNKIKNKKKELKSKSSSVTLKTNCTFSFSVKNTGIDKAIILSTVTDSNILVDILLFLYEKKNGLKTLEDRGLKVSNYKWNGYSVDDWIHDVEAKLTILTVREELKALEKYEKSLTDMFSPDKKQQNEFDDILAGLGNLSV